MMRLRMPQVEPSLTASIAPRRDGQHAGAVSVVPLPGSIPEVATELLATSFELVDSVATRLPRTPPVHGSRRNSAEEHRDRNSA